MNTVKKLWFSTLDKIKEYLLAKVLQIFYREMATFKTVVIGPRKRNDGTWNVKIRVIHNRKTKYISTSWYVTKEDLTKSYKIKNQSYIEYTDELIKSFRQICDRMGEKLKSMIVDDVCDLVTGRSGNQDLESFDLDIVDYWEKNDTLDE